MIFNFRKRDKKIKAKEKAIITQKRQHTRMVNQDLQALKGLNDILSNGISLEIKRAIGGRHG